MGDVLAAMTAIFLELQTILQSFFIFMRKIINSFAASALQLYEVIL